MGSHNQKSINQGDIYNDEYLEESLKWLFNDQQNKPVDYLSLWTLPSFGSRPTQKLIGRFYLFLNLIHS